MIHIAGVLSGFRRGFGSGGEEGEGGPGEGGGGGGEGGLVDLGYSVIHEVAAGTHGAEDGGVGDGGALVAKDAAILDGGETEDHEEIGVS